MKTCTLRLAGFALALLLTVPFFSACSSTATRESTGEYIDDSILTAKVKTALARDPVVNAFAVKVETFRGTVQLSGFVDSEEQRQQAGIVAQGVEGVQEVQNNVSVKPASEPAPAR